MRIAYAIDSLGSGGAQRQAVALARAVHARDNVQVQFVVYHSFDFWVPALRAADIRVTCLNRKSRYDPSYPLRMRRWLKREKIDLVHAFLLGPALWQRLARLGWWSPARPVFVAAERSALIARTTVQEILQRIVYGGADAVTANAESVASEIRSKLGVAPERVRYLPNGIDLAEWDRSSSAACPFLLEPGRFHIGLIGGLRPEKNHLVLLDALELVEPFVRKSWTIWFVGAETGSSHHAERVRSEVRRRGLTPFVRFERETYEIAPLIRALDLVVLPSRYEGFPNVILEAMASRTPTVATAVGNVPNLVTDRESGLLVDPGDAAGLANAMVAIYQMTPAERERMGLRGREMAEAQFDIKAVARGYLALYRRLLEERSSSLTRTSS